MKVRKQLSFDLDTSILKEMFGEDKYTKAYSDIKSFMKKNDCEHIEGSVYMSKQNMSNLEVLNLLADLKEQYPYITKCVRSMHQANISDIHSLSAEFEYDGTAGRFSQKETSRENKPVKSTSLSERLARKKAIVEQQKNKNQTKYKSHNQEL